MADVFVSYSRKNRDRVAAISGALEESGYSLWWDRQLATGADYGTVIEREIGAASCVVVAWSATARDSLWVRAEANEALDSGKLVQLSLDGSKLPLPFTMLHFLDFASWQGARSGSPWSDLDGRVRTMVGGGGAEPIAERRAAAVPEGPRLQGLGPAAMLGSAALALAALMAIAIGAAAAGALPAGLFGPLAATGFAIAAIMMALVAWMMMRTLAASRR
ncbi:toll/interleukin-1 receptor domain-containing protein [Allosphingosinicella sp.]|jgi:hypothetical protein|uniref:toll/interleukin-1 receptor domain-containing protein n=1 Tax=Allosphingosinicella sp. TaxID=2823234 RepID=UPI002EF894F4